MKTVCFNILRDDGYAKKAGFKENDVILELNGQPITETQQVSDVIVRGKSTFKLARGVNVVSIDVDSPTLGVVLGEREFDLEAFNRSNAIATLKLSTNPTLPGHEITQTLDIVGAQCVYGVNAFADIAGGLRELVGGRSKAIQDKLAEARREVSQELREEAYKLGANAVISVTFEHSEIGDKGGFMLMVTATGTAAIYR